MKKLFLLMLLIVTVFVPTFSFDDARQTKKDDMETLLPSGDLKIGGYGAFEMREAMINHELGLMLGGKGAVVLNGVVALGGGGYSYVLDHKAPIYTDSTRYYIRSDFGGFYIEYMDSPNKLLHYTISTMIGGGKVRYDMNNNKDDDPNEKISSIFFIEPAVGAELNVAKFMRINLGVSYRFVTGVDLPKFENKDISGLSANLAFKFGWFDAFKVPNEIDEIFE